MWILAMTMGQNREGHSSRTETRVFSVLREELALYKCASSSCAVVRSPLSLIATDLADQYSASTINPDKVRAFDRELIINYQCYMHGNIRISVKYILNVSPIFICIRECKWRAISMTDNYYAYIIYAINYRIIFHNKRTCNIFQFYAKNFMQEILCMLM